MTPEYNTEFLDLLAKLDHTVASVGESVEGNLFYKHEDADFPNAAIAPYFAPKRANLLAACLGRGRVLEIGTNAGHAALLMLYHNPKLHYTGVDICKHKYVAKAIDFLKERFPDRVDFYPGDSVQVLPDMLAKKVPAAFDVVHVDGLHTTFHCENDINNAAKLCTRFAWVIVDDTTMPNIAEIYERYVRDGKLLGKAPEGWEKTPHHAIGMLPT